MRLASGSIILRKKVRRPSFEAVALKIGRPSTLQKICLEIVIRSAKHVAPAAPRRAALLWWPHRASVTRIRTSTPEPNFDCFANTPACPLETGLRHADHTA